MLQCFNKTQQRPISNWFERIYRSDFPVLSMCCLNQIAITKQNALELLSCAISFCSYFIITFNKSSNSWHQNLWRRQETEKQHELNHQILFVLCVGVYCFMYEHPVELTQKNTFKVNEKNKL